MMSGAVTDEMRYIFDLQGYLVIPGLLGSAQVARMQAALTSLDGGDDISKPQNDPGQSRFQFLHLGQDFHGLIDHPRVFPLLQELIGPKLRLDHAYGMAMSTAGEAGGEGMHHGGTTFAHGCYYVNHGQQMHNGLLVVSWALCDVPAGAGGFCCVPGSHKQLFPTPPSLSSIKAARNGRTSLVVQPELLAGDCLIFSEALRHETME